MRLTLAGEIKDGKRTFDQIFRAEHAGPIHHRKTIFLLRQYAAGCSLAALMQIGLAQINAVIGDFPGNVKRILAAYRECLDAGADLVITPELSRGLSTARFGVQISICPSLPASA